MDSAYYADKGSSPHTRGALANSEIDHRSKRDHPRIRGEHVCADTFFNGRRGSSPHTRGAQLRLRRPHAQAGIIPAYAGSTRYL